MTEEFVLALDVSGAAGSVALVSFHPDGAEVSAAEEPLAQGFVHGVELAPAAARLLGKAGIAAKDLSLVACGVGPGSWTGVRVGVAFAKSLAFAARVPLFGVPSFDAIAAGLPAGRDVAVVRDARRDAVYLGLYPAGRTEPRAAGGIRLVSPAEADRAIPDGALLVGDGPARHPLLLGRGRSVADAAGEVPAAAVARIARARIAREGPTPPHDLTPLYLRPSEAEERADRREAGE